MFQKIIIILIITLSLQACSKNKEVEYEFNDKKVDPYKLYEEGFKKGFELAQQKMSDHVSEIKETHIVPRQMERKIIGYQFRKPRQAEIDSVINKVCIKYEVSKKELLTKCRRRDIVRSRNILHNVLNEKYKMNLTNIGRIFGQDHTTVLYSIQMKFNKTFYWDKNQTIWEETYDLFN